MKNNLFWILLFGLSVHFIGASEPVAPEESKEESIVQESTTEGPVSPPSISGHGRVVRRAWVEPVQHQRPPGCLARLRSNVKPLHLLLCSVIAAASFAGTSYVIDERCTKAEQRLFQDCLPPETNMTGQCYHVAASQCFSYINGGDYAYQARSPLICSTGQPILAQDILKTSAAQNLTTQHPGAKLCVLTP